MGRKLRPIGHDERLSLVDHLDELRSRLIVCGLALVVAFGFCFWQNHALIHLLNRALPRPTSQGLAAVPHTSASLGQAMSEIEKGASALSSSSTLSPADRHAAAVIAQGANEAAKALPSSAPQQEKPITIGVGESFTTTLLVAAYFALLLTLPVLIYEAYAFVIPALHPNERGVAAPVVVVAPLLFIVGVVFAYLLVLPPAVHFLQGYNSGSFDILVQAKSYYTFEIYTMLGVGLAFQIPLGLLALQRLGAINARTLTRNWRYATVIIAVIAAAMPGADPVSTAFEMLPLVVLYLASIVILMIADRRTAARAHAKLSEPLGEGLDPT